STEHFHKRCSGKQDLGQRQVQTSNTEDAEEISPSPQGKHPPSSHKARAQKRRRETVELQLIETQLANQGAIREWFQHSAAAQVKNAEIAQRLMEFDTLQRLAGIRVSMFESGRLQRNCWKFYY